MLVSLFHPSARVLSQAACNVGVNVQMQQRAFRSIYSRVFDKIKDVIRPQPPKPPYKHVCVIGDPVLRSPTQLVPLDDPSKAREVRKLFILTVSVKTVIAHNMPNWPIVDHFIS